MKSTPDVLAALLTREQARAARAMLEWTVREAAARARVGQNTVNRFEMGAGARAPTRQALRLAYEAAGCTFLPANRNGPGVRVKPPPAA